MKVNTDGYFVNELKLVIRVSNRDTTEFSIVGPEYRIELSRDDARQLITMLKEKEK